jgi:hypothetical protein
MKPWTNKLYRPQRKMSSSKKLAWKGTLRHVFIRILVTGYTVQSVTFVFSAQLCELLPLSPSLWFNSPPFPV